MGEVWIPEAEDLAPRGSAGTMSGQGGPRATLHCTVSNPGSFDAMDDVLTSKQAESHLLYDYKTDRLGQYFPLNKSSRALMSGSHSVSHNKMGTVNIQVEVCAQPVDWTADDDWHPGPNFRAMVRAIRSWGIADRFVYRLATSGGDNVRRSWDTFDSTSTGGGMWWGHCHVPSPESHWDPGPLNLAAFFGAADSEDDDMPSAEEVAKAVWRYDQDGNASQAWSYQRDGAKRVWQYDQDGAARQGWSYQKEIEEITDALTAVRRGVEDLRAAVEELADPSRGPRGHGHEDDDDAPGVE